MFVPEGKGYLDSIHRLMPPSSVFSSSSSSRSSPTPPPQKSKDKGQPKKSGKADIKGKKKLTSATLENVNHDKVGTSWEYEPPKGAALINTRDEDAGEFDWDAVNNDSDIELWLIRVPESVKPKHLENFTIDPPSSSSSSCLGSLKRKHMTFDLWTVAEDDAKLPIGGEELKNISCLLPRKSKNGQLYPASKPFAHHLVLAAQAIKPTPPSADDAMTTQGKNSPRFSYPKELLKHRFMPYGSLTTIPAHAPLELDEDMEKEIPKVPLSSRKKKDKEADTADVEVKKRKKRKMDVVIDLSKSPAAKRHKQAKMTS